MRADVNDPVVAAALVVGLEDILQRLIQHKGAQLELTLTATI